MTISMIDLPAYNLGELNGLQDNIEKVIKSCQLHEVSKAREQNPRDCTEIRCLNRILIRQFGKENQGWEG
jgi:hypothetical protein